MYSFLAAVSRGAILLLVLPSLLATRRNIAHNRHEETDTAIDLSPVRACLSLGDAKLQYPLDAEAHFEEIHAAMGRWMNNSRYHATPDYSGPWIENWWISNFTSRWRSQAPGTPLRATFGPYIPLLVPWVDKWVLDDDVSSQPTNWSYPPEFVSTLLGVLRPTVPYVTVSQNDEGLQGKEELLMKNIPNVLVLSAGGYGHGEFCRLFWLAVAAERNQPPQFSSSFPFFFRGGRGNS